MTGRIVIFGSINMDLVVRGERLPLPGETIHGQRFFTAPGGKGANQAVASARLQAETRIIGCVGDDLFGSTLIDSMHADGVDTTHVRVIDQTSTGVALITVSETGENTIVLAAGANAHHGTEELAALRDILRQTAAHHVLLLQLEIDLRQVEEATRIAKASGMTVILDPAPARPLPDALFQNISLLTPNESEAALLVGYPLSSNAAVEQAALDLLARGCEQIVIKLGGRGAYWTDGTQTVWLKPFPVTAVDTVAAGDAFNGAVAAALSKGLAMSEALRWGMAAGALSVTCEGAQPSLPTLAELEALLQ